jgi:uncharacterized membrane protein YgaE (UPF0421/DUF939 family)
MINEQLRQLRHRVDGHLWPIVQTALAAVSAWYIALLFGVERRPAFASIAAVISLGAAFFERRQRAVQLIGGVMLGIVVADLLMRARSESSSSSRCWPRCCSAAASCS